MTLAQNGCTTLKHIITFKKSKSTTSRITDQGMPLSHFMLFSYAIPDLSRMEQFQKAIRKVRQVQRMRKQRGYAFSQADESQTRVLQAYDTTRERGRYGEMASSKPKGR